MHSDLLRLRLAEANPIFMAAQLALSRSCQQQIRVMSGGAIMPGINVTKLKQLEVLSPPASEQREFAERVAALGTGISQSSASSKQLDTLFASLQQRAFAGEL